MPANGSRIVVSPISSMIAYSNLATVTDEMIATVLGFPKELLYTDVDEVNTVIIVTPRSIVEPHHVAHVKQRSVMQEPAVLQLFATQASLKILVLAQTWMIASSSIATVAIGRMAFNTIGNLFASTSDARKLLLEPQFCVAIFTAIQQTIGDNMQGTRNVSLDIVQASMRRCIS